MRISPFAITITIILAASCLILGCREGSPVSSAESTKAPSDPGHRRMIEILDAIEEQAGREVLFLRTTDLDDVELRWSSLP
ncbi:MAG: hypothetical protein KDB18_14035, partial [Salinibacterium sp.]|nr:hypothetical protein [Salinibacterium sp.]